MFVGQPKKHMFLRFWNAFIWLQPTQLTGLISSRVDERNKPFAANT